MSAETPLKDHRAERQLFVVRAAIAGALIVLAIGLLLARLSYLQILEHDYYSLRSTDNRTRVQVVPPVRGLIYDRNGVILADNVPAYRLESVPEQIEDMDAALTRLAKIIEIRAVDRERFRKRRRESPRFQGIPIRLNLSAKEVARFEINRRAFPGMEVRAGLSRHYPYGEVAAHLVGYVGGISARELRRLDAKRYRGSNHVGKTGVEKSYEARLHGEPGSRIVEANAAGRPLRELAFEAPKPGNSLYLTLDIRLQQAAYKALAGRTGAVVALDPQTGGVLAMASRPGFDPAPFVNGIDSKAYQRLLKDPRKPLFNRALQGQYPPGSTIKPLMALAALDNGSIDPDRKVWCPGYITLPGSTRHWRDWKRTGHGWVDLPTAIYRSSDVYFYKLGMALGIDNMHRFAQLFGLGRKTGIDLPREREGLMPSRAWKNGVRNQPWYPGETLNTVIGQGFMTATPLQLAQMTALIAGRGDGHTPHILMATKSTEGIRRQQTVDKQAVPPIGGADEANWKLVVDAMEQVVHGQRGTAHLYVGGDLPYRLAGKSGTSQVTALAQDQSAPEYEDVAQAHRDHALFIAFAPADDPRIAVAAVIEHGGGGSSTAGPIARQVIDAYLLGDRMVQREVRQ